MRWATLETEGDRPPLAVWSRHELDLEATGSFGVRRRTTKRARHLTPSECKAIAEAYRDGRTWEWIENHFNRHRTTIRKALEREGVSTGDRNGRRPERSSAHR